MGELSATGTLTRASKISPALSPSVYEFIHFTRPYNGLRGDLSVSRSTCPTWRLLVPVDWFRIAINSELVDAEFGMDRCQSHSPYDVTLIPRPRDRHRHHMRHSEAVGFVALGSL